MEQKIQTETPTAEVAAKVKKPLCVWSVIAFLISVVAFGSYCLVLGAKNRTLIPVWEVLGCVSIFAPTIAKHMRLSKDQSGRRLEIAAIVIGGYAFCMIIFLLTKWSVYIGYLGWIAGGLIYKSVKQ